MNDEPQALTEGQRQRLHAQLLALKDSLGASLLLGEAGAKPVDLDEPIGRLSRIDALAQREINDAGRRQQTLDLSAVKLALESLDASEYGLCRACDEPIGFARLQAVPFAAVCLRCQSQRERPS